MRWARRAAPRVLEAAPVPGLPTLEKPYRNAGLHDLALHPDYAKNHFVYFSFNKAGDMTPASGNAPARQQSRLTVMRARFDGKSLSDLKEIFVGKSAGTSGSRIAFGADGLLYMQIGAAVGDEAQRMDNTIGKVLRVQGRRQHPGRQPLCGAERREPRGVHARASRSAGDGLASGRGRHALGRARAQRRR